MNTIDLEKLHALLALEGIGISTDLQAVSPKAKGKLKESYTSEVVTKGSTLIMRVSAADTYFFVRGGRRAGAKMPPLDRIREWCKDKGISVRAAFPIARSIGIKGIKPKPLLDDVLKKRKPLEPELRRLFGETIKTEMDDVWKRLFGQS